MIPVRPRMPDLLAMSHGLGVSVLGGQSSAEQAHAVIDYHLDRLFPPPPP